MDLDDLAGDMAREILAELSCRRGFDNAWDECDPFVRTEIYREVKGRISRGLNSLRPADVE